MDFKKIIFEKKDRIAKITLNRPEAMNAQRRNGKWPDGCISRLL